MSTLKNKPTKQDVKKKDQAESSRFLLIVVLSTLVLMVLMYFIFVN